MGGYQALFAVRRPGTLGGGAELRGQSRTRGSDQARGQVPGTEACWSRSHPIRAPFVMQHFHPIIRIDRPAGKPPDYEGLVHRVLSRFASVLA